ncbi:arginine n-methyltransferase [Cystoisospora suis]|uniref:Arginine n-methyltransferase n=1 Tax=Cystoisospora suis TaxID=483139 RepID=A0A2C6L5I5_9APIC|nr:arginine n-methyltransferase [Cystoisospora suis]
MEETATHENINGRAAGSRSGGGVDKPTHGQGVVGGSGSAPTCMTATVMTCDEKTKQEFASGWQDLEQENLSSADYYFNSYAHFGIHEEMLKDSVRTGCYQRAICQNSHLFADKIVLDVGSGTGILSLFAARAGAKHVYGIECSEIVNIARKVVRENEMEDKITFIQGKAEEVSLPVDKVDIIVSEWMGYFLLYESMLDTVLFCRDKWLKPGGMVFPDKASLYIAAIEDADYKLRRTSTRMLPLSHAALQPLLVMLGLPFLSSGSDVQDSRRPLSSTQAAPYTLHLSDAVGNDSLSTEDKYAEGQPMTVHSYSYRWASSLLRIDTTAGLGHRPADLSVLNLQEEKIGYWSNVYGFNFSCVRRCVMEEPIVDTVEENAVATTACCVLKLDLATCKKEDLDFCAPYQITLRRKDFLHALIAWFDVCFSQCHKPVVLSTGPHCRYTHWKQTVFYMEDVLVADVGDKVEGMIAVKKSRKNPRDLDIKISYNFKPKHSSRPLANTQFYRLR